MKNILIVLSLILLFTSCDSNKAAENMNVTLKDTVKIEAIDSLVYFTNKIKDNPNVARSWAARSNYNLSLGSVNDALIDMSTAVTLDSTNVDYRVGFADLLMGTLDLEGAQYNYNYALAIDSSNAKAYVGNGRIYALLNNPGMATGYLNKAYKIDPHLSEAYFLEGMIYRSDFYETGRDESWDRALSSYQTAVEQNPKYYSAYIEMGVMNYEMGKDIALDYFNTAIDIAPNSTEAWYNKGMFYQTKKDYNTAKWCYRTILGIDSSYSQAYFNQGYISLSYEEQFDSAVFFFEKAIENDSLYFYAYNNLGLSHERNGDMIKAKSAYRSAIEINPDFKLAKENLHSLK
jgi:tetratricopeptide (TPR) repeat protein